MRIIGIDPGYAIVGYGVVEVSSGRYRPIEYGAVTTQAGDDFPARLQEIYEGMTQLIAQHRPQAAAVEKLYFTNNKTTGIGVAEARGVILLALAQGGVPLYEYTPMQVKQAVTGYGRAEKKQVVSALRDALMTLPRGEIDYDIGTDIRMNAVDAQPRRVEEALDVTQGKLCLGFRLGACMEEPDFAAIAVFNAMYGGAVTSRLFLNVREKLSLCYYASSLCDSSKGVMAVSSGIEFDRRDEAEHEILAQLEALRSGDFTEEELVSARKAVAGELRAMTDSPGALEDFYLTQNLRGLDYGPDVFAELCESVTREDILAVASDIQLDTVYFLRGAEEDEEEEETEEAADDAEA